MWHHTHREVAKWEGLGLGIRAIAMLALGLVTAVVAHVAGLDGRFDRDLRRAYYRIASPPFEEPPCLIVAFDEATTRRWGPPPWPAERIAAVLARATQAGAKLVAIVEPAARLVGSGSLPSSSALSTGSRDDLSLIDVPGVPFEEIFLREPTGHRTLAGQLMARIAPSLADGAALFVHYAPEGSVLPSVPAYRVASGEMPGSLLRGRVLLLGMTDPMFARKIWTPVGFLQPAQVHASAVLSALGATPNLVPMWARWLCTLILLSLHAWLVARRTERSMFRVSGLMALCAVALDAVLFNAMHLTVGVSLLLFGLGGATAMFVMDDRRLAKQTLRTSLRTLARYRPTQAAEGTEHDAAFWERLGSLAAPYFDPRSSALFVLADNGQHLVLRWSRGMVNDDIQERRRDIGRSPYNKALSSQRAIWEPHFMQTEHAAETLLVPLTAFSRVLGFWVLNFNTAHEVDAAGLGLIEYLAREATAILERRHLDEDRRLPSLLGGSRLRQSIEAVSDAAERVSGAQAGYQQMLDVMPVGLLVASITGEVIFANPAMSQALGEAGVPAAAQRWLADILGRLTRDSIEQVRGQLRELICDPQALALRATSDSGDAVPYAFGMFRLGHGALVGVGGENQALWPGTFVLTAHPNSDDVVHAPIAVRTIPPPPSIAPPARGLGVDLRELLLRIARRLRARYEECDRPMALELSDPAPLLAAATGRGLSRALAAVLYDVLRHGSESAPVRVLVEQDGLETLLRITDPVHALPQAALFALTAQPAGVVEDAHTMMSLAQAKQLLASMGASLEIESRIGSGTMFTLRLAPEVVRESILPART